MATSHHEPSFIVYDGDCPFCRRYVHLLRLRDSVGDVELINARERHPVVANLLDAGYDLNEGIAFVQGANVYFAEDAMTRLALSSTPSGWFNRLNARLLSSPTVSRAAYPILKTGRSLVLRLLGRGPIRH
ncbi:MAG: DCC1-like thiol-disulfide oxidoreductase family protein [Pseudomonadota bacterium]